MEATHKSLRIRLKTFIRERAKKRSLPARLQEKNPT